MNAALPVVDIYADGTQCLVLIDTGLEERACCGVGVVSISTDEGNSIKIDVLVVYGKPLGIDLLLGIDAIKVLGGIIVGPTGSVQLKHRRTTKCAAISINEPDFTATFDHHSRTWTASWKWSEDHAPKRLHNKVSEYPVVAEIRNEYMQELHTWIGNGWLVPYLEDKLGPPKGLIPLMAILQQNKTKVHPVMDYRELNLHVDTYIANADVCTAKLCEQRQKGANVSLLDLRRVYLQIHVHETLDKSDCKDRWEKILSDPFGFWLKCGPLIMKAIISAVLSQEEAMGRTVSAYINDIYVNEDVVPATLI